MIAPIGAQELGEKNDGNHHGRSQGFNNKKIFYANLYYSVDKLLKIKH